MTVSIGIVYFSFLGLSLDGIAPAAISARIIIFAIYLTGGLFFWTYSAGLVSFLTVEKFEFPIQNIEVSR